VSAKPLRVVFVDPPVRFGPGVDELCNLDRLDVNVSTTAPYDADEIVERGSGADVLVVDSITHYSSLVLRRLPNLQALVTASPDTHHIDVTYCRRRGLPVINFPGYNARAAAETAVGYVLASALGAPLRQQASLASGRMTYAVSREFHRGWEVVGKRLGVIGAGHIGAELITLGQALGMQVLCHTQRPSSARARSLGLRSFQSLPDLLKESDAVVVAVGAGTADHALIGATQFGLMKPEAVLVSVGAWQAVDFRALADAVYRERIASAVICCGPSPLPNSMTDDLLVQEMLRSSNVMFRHEPIYTQESAERLTRMLEAALKSL
jgi:glycerate dehydrogenase